jgi:hypothetical protein
VIGLVAGAAALCMAELAGVAALRIVAAALLAAGAIAVGAAMGLTPTSRTVFKRVAGIVSRGAVYALAVVLVAPAVAACAAGAATLFASWHTATALALLGGIAALLLSIAAGAALVVGIAAISGSAPRQMHDGEA